MDGVPDASPSPVAEVSSTTASGTVPAGDGADIPGNAEAGTAAGSFFSVSRGKDNWGVDGLEAGPSTHSSARETAAKRTNANAPVKIAFRKTWTLLNIIRLPDS